MILQSGSAQVMNLNLGARSLRPPPVLTPCSMGTPFRAPTAEQRAAPPRAALFSLHHCPPSTAELCTTPPQGLLRFCVLLRGHAQLHPPLPAPPLPVTLGGSSQGQHGAVQPSSLIRERSINGSLRAARPAFRPGLGLWQV